MKTIEQIPDIKVTSYTFSQIIELSKTRPDIADHIIAGFGIPSSDTRSKEEIIKDEYNHGENRTLIFLAEVEGKVVGSLYFILWRNDVNDKRGGKFLQYLAENASDLIDLDKLKEFKTLACDVGIVIHPDYQGRGVVNQLYSEGVKLAQPAFVVGQTKTPGAVIARSRILEACGYLTSYGGLPVSLEMSLDVAADVADAYYFARKDVAKRIDGRYVHYAETEALQPEIHVDMDRLSPNIRATFENILEFDTNRPNGSITFSPLVSINKKIIK